MNTARLGHRQLSSLRLGHRNVHDMVADAVRGAASKAMLAGDAMQKSSHFLKGAEVSAAGIHPKLGVAASYVADKMKVGGDLAHKLGAMGNRYAVKKGNGLIKHA